MPDSVAGGNFVVNEDLAAHGDLVDDGNFAAEGNSDEGLFRRSGGRSRGVVGGGEARALGEYV